MYLGCDSSPMILNILKCRKEGMREKKNVRMPPQTSAQYLEAISISNSACVSVTQIKYTCQPGVSSQGADSHSIMKHAMSSRYAGKSPYSLLTPVTM